MLDHFTFPVNFNDLEKEAPGMNRHRVFLTDLNIPDRELLRHLKSIDSAFNENSESITEQETFDFLYTLVKTFSESIDSKSMPVLEELARTIQYLTDVLLRQLRKITEEDNVPRLRVTFKMVMFLCLYFVSGTAPRKVKATQGDIIADAINKQKGKRKQKQEQASEVSRTVFECQRNCIQLMRDSLRVDFVLLWQRKDIDGEFFKKYVDVCIKILESSMAKDEDISVCIFAILESILNSSYCQTLATTFQTVLANLVYEGEVTDNLVNFFAGAQGAQLQKVCTSALQLVVLYLMNKQNLNSESQSIKSTREFLSKLSERIPRTFYTNLSYFIPLFKHDSYLLRNAIIDVMNNIFRFVLAPTQQDDDAYREPREKFLSTLLQRIYDKSSFCRCHVLGVLGRLAADKMVPKKYLLLLMKAGIDRVKDQSSNTRKKALQLINAVTDQLCPDDQITPLDDIERQLEVTELEIKTLNEEEEKLKLEMDQVDEEEKLQELVRSVKLIRKRVKLTEQKQIELVEQREVTNLIQRVIGSTSILLGSKSDNDVLETIRLFIKLHRMGFEGAKNVLPQIRILIFSKEKKIRDEVLTNFIYLHLNMRSQEVAKQLTHLFSQATPQDLSALEQILQTVIVESLNKDVIIIKQQAYAHMWNQFIQYEKNNTHQAEKRAIVTILRVAFSKDASLIKDENMDSFLNILKSYADSRQPDFHVLKEISCIATIEEARVSSLVKKFLVAQVYILVTSQGTSNNEWYSACESVLTCIFKTCESPEKLSEMLIKRLQQRLNQERSVKSLCQFIFTLSHTCLKCLIYLDTIEGKVKGVRQRQMMQSAGQDEEQLDKVMGGEQAELEKRIEEIQGIAEHMVDDPFINKWLNIIEKIVINFREGTELETISVLAYSKMMCLSSTFCQEKFPHLVRLLSNPAVGPVVKNNLIIAMGDLLHRFPNVVEPHSRIIYTNLHDKDPNVRKTTLTVITHLSLNDVIKVKEDLCNLAIMFNDQDQQIANLVRQFFHQLNKKDPKTLFNLIPQALKRFSNLEGPGHEQSTFRSFLENILPMLEKDKYSESLVIKLCEKMSNSLNMLELSNTAYCLSEINLNQKGVRRLIENFETFRKRMDNPDIVASFKTLVTKLKKTQKGDLKSLIEELEEKVMNAGEEVFNADEVRKRNMERVNKKQPKKKPPQPPATAKRGGRRRRVIEEEEDEDQDDHENQEELVTHSLARNRPQRNRGMRVIQESDENGEQDEDYYGESK